MPLAAIWSSLVSRLRRPKQASKKPAWGKHSHIDLLADGLARDREGWVIEQNAIRRNGVVIAWRGDLGASATSVTVTMDGQRYAVTAEEIRKLKERLREFLESRQSG